MACFSSSSVSRIMDVLITNGVGVSLLELRRLLILFFTDNTHPARRYTSVLRLTLRPCIIQDIEIIIDMHQSLT